MYREIDYEELIDSGMRIVIREILKNIALQGQLPGKHYFHITFETNYPGVVIPSYLADKYPDKMPIAIQNQYKNLQILSDTFSVTLTFGGKDERLVIPFCAILEFLDPSTHFRLNLAPDKLGGYGKSKFHSMLSEALYKDRSSESDKEEKDNIILFDEIRNA